ncbi:MAG: RidA family protein [Deltaproteobacteria bacterium]|nr:RidA family protein [Deltaproteobacteria bacterium]
MQKKIISTEAAPAAIGPYSQAVLAPGGLLFTSGQIPLDPATGEMVGGGEIAAETEQVMKNLEAVLAAAGLGFADVVQSTIFLADLGDFTVVNEIYGARFESEPPARATVQVAALPKGARVEISCIAAGPR